MPPSAPAPPRCSRRCSCGVPPARRPPGWPRCSPVAEPTVVRRRVDTEEVLDALRTAAAALGVEAYLVGGFVRDRLLGRGISKDIDALVVGDGAVELLARVARGFGWSRPQQFERFGTVQIRGDDFVVEAVRARRERYNPDSRKPDVEPGTLEEDIWRRDFTVNALAQDFQGRVLDLTGRGVDDLLAGVLRTPLDPADTFDEDPLRMFRGARFVAQLHFRLAPGVVEAMRAQAHLARPPKISVERIRDELARLLTSPHPRDGVQVLHDGGLLTESLPEVEAMIGVEQSGWHCYDVYDHTLHALDRTPTDDLITRLAVLLHDVGKPPTHAVAEDGRHTFHDHPHVPSSTGTTPTETRRCGGSSAPPARSARSSSTSPAPTPSHPRTRGSRRSTSSPSGWSGSTGAARSRVPRRRSTGRRSCASAAAAPAPGWAGCRRR
ncbi:MAG: CCA tRNA nucleotidyltransferase [Chloroflexi bacterium]|nr:MAG: CCA tRNA nucleotidyltransferase [Chloroflexota bacterium]